MVAFRDLSPLYELSAVFALRPVRLIWRDPSVLYPYFMYLPISMYFVSSKVLEVLTEWNSAERTSIHIILLVLYLVMGIPDICCIFIHIQRQRKDGASLMAHFGAVNPKKCPKIYHKFLVPVGIIAYISLNMAWCFTYGFEVLENICKVTINVASYLILMQFCTYLDLVKAKMIEGFPVDSGAILETVSNHLELLKKAGWANRYFSRQLLILCIRIMMNSIIKIYYLLYFISLSNRNVAIVLVATLAWEFFLLGVLTRCCNSLSKMALEFNKKLFKIIRKDKDLCNNEKLKLYVLMKPGITFTACGFFNIGYPLVTSIIAAAMTYLVILVQFSNS